MGAGVDRVQLATYPQSPFSGPARCCDVTDLYQAFLHRTGPGRLWISLGAGLLFAEVLLPCCIRIVRPSARVLPGYSPLPNPQMGVAPANPHNILRHRQPKGPVNRL